MRLHEQKFVDAKRGDVMIESSDKKQIYLTQTNMQTITIDRAMLPSLIKRLKKEVPPKWYSRPWWVWAITISGISLYLVKLFSFICNGSSIN